MAIVGTGGVLELNREWPLPMVLSPEAVDTSASKLFIANQQYITGDHVMVAVSGGLPIDVDGDGYADNPDGHGVYPGSKYQISPILERLISSSSIFFDTDDQRFYDTRRITETYNAYININDTGRASLYKSELAAYNKKEDELVEFFNVKINNMIVAPSPIKQNNNYTNIIKRIARHLKTRVLEESSQNLEKVISIPKDLKRFADNPDNRSWRIQCDLTDWALNTDVQTLDITAIGEAFGEKAKSVVSGSGSLNFLVDNRYREGKRNSIEVFRLVMLTKQGSKAVARFNLYKDSNASPGQLGQSLYKQCDIIFNRSTLNTRAGDLITGSVDFVTTGEVMLRFT